MLLKEQRNLVPVEEDMRSIHIDAMKEAVNFFKNKNKLDREKWVVKHFLDKLCITYDDHEILGAEEPADIAFRDIRFQVKELYPEGRRRDKEYKEKLKKALEANDVGDLLEEYTPTAISFTEIVQLCSDYTIKLIDSNKYGVKEREKTDLLYYFNYVKSHETPPEQYVFNINGFRSVSVVGNRYCAVLTAIDEASSYLTENIGNVVSVFKG